MTSIKLVTVPKQVTNNNNNIIGSLTIQKPRQEAQPAPDPLQTSTPPRPAQLLPHWAKNNNFRKRTERKVKEPPLVPTGRYLYQDPFSSLWSQTLRGTPKKEEERKEICLVSRSAPHYPPQLSPSALRTLPPSRGGQVPGPGGEMRRETRRESESFSLPPLSLWRSGTEHSKQLLSALEFIKLKEKLFIDAARVGGPGRPPRPRGAPARARPRSRHPRPRARVGAPRRRPLPSPPHSGTHHSRRVESRIHLNNQLS